MGSELPESPHRVCTCMAEANIVKAKMIIKPILGLKLLPRNKKENGKENHELVKLKYYIDKCKCRVITLT